MNKKNAFIAMIALCFLQLVSLRLHTSHIKQLNSNLN